MEKIKELDRLNVGRVIYQVPLKEYTTYRVGGIGKALVIVDDCECLVKLVRFLEEKNKSVCKEGSGCKERATPLKKLFSSVEV